LNDGEVVDGELVVPRCKPPTLLELIEGPFDQIASPVKLRAQAECLFPIPLWRDVRPNTALMDERSDPVDVIATITQQHCSRLQAEQEPGGKPVIVRFAGCARTPDRQAIGIDQRLNLARRTASRPAHGLSLVASDAGRALMHTHNGCVDHS
jgi:hypothetical protein